MKCCFFVLISLLASCSSDPKNDAPAWTHESTRIVDNGYIVYVGLGEAPSLEKAQFKAEGQALEDLANECSMIPLGTRIEDRFSNKEKYDYRAFVKLAVEFKDCDATKKSLDPTEIKKLASVPFTQQLKRYQDLIETGEMTNPQEETEVAALKEVTPLPPASADGNTQFYVNRQYVAYQKEIVVLSPPQAYAPASPETQTFTTAVKPVVAQVQNQEAQNPQLKTQPQAWSHLPDRPAIERPQALQAAANETRLRQAGDRAKAFSDAAARGLNNRGGNPNAKKSGGSHHGRHPKAPNT